jgi:hypothetical protein
LLGRNNIAADMLVTLGNRRDYADSYLLDVWGWKNYVPSGLREPITQLRSGVFQKDGNIMWITFVMYKVCSKKDRTFAIKTSFYNILTTVPFKVVPSTGDTPFPTFLPLLERFLERTLCDGTQFSYRIFLNLCLFKKKKTKLFK